MSDVIAMPPIESLYKFPDGDVVLCDACARRVVAKTIKVIGAGSWGEHETLDRNVPCGDFADAVWLDIWRTA